MKNFTQPEIIRYLLRKTLLWLPLFVFLFGFVSIATAEEHHQGIKVTGTISDNNEPLPGVNVMVKGTVTGVVTDQNGRYTINIPSKEAVLVFSFIGYVTREIPVGDQTTISINLEEDTKQLEEVVVVGYGTVRKKDLTGSVSSIKSDELKKLPMTSFDQGIQGRAAGVQVTNATGAPGGQVAIRVRGGNSLSSSNQPLYVIDGFPVAAGGMAGGNIAWAALANNPLATLNPSDIESIEILKDASAAAIYGSRGANGVILITTKRGKTGNAKVTYDGYAGVQQVAKKLDYMNGEEFATMANVAAANSGLAPIYGGSDPKWKTPSYYRDNYTDWQDLVFRNAWTQSHQLSVTGGSETTQYAISGNYFDQEGIVLNTGLKRGSFRTNVDTKIASWVKVAASLTASRTSTDITTSESNFSTNRSGVMHGVLTLPPTMPLYEDDGVTFTTMNPTPYGSPIGNAYAIALLSKDRAETDRVLANIEVKFELDRLVKGLALQVMGGTDYSSSTRGSYYPSTTYYGQSVGGLASNSWSKGTSFLNENLLTYQNKIGKHSINALAGMTVQSFQYSGGRTTVSGFVNDILEDYSLGAATKSDAEFPSSYRNGSTQASWLGRVNYNYADRYLFTFTGRADGSSKFGTNNKWGFFPSVAAAWRLSEEAFMDNINWLSNTKLRVSYGSTGNQDFGSYASIASLAQYPYNLGGAKVTGFAPNKIPNSNLRWESTTTLDFGVDMGFFDNRLNITADYYRKKTKNLLWNVSIPLSTGFSSIFSNHGSLENWGFEASISYELITGNHAGAFTWNTNLMYSMNRNKVVSLPGVTPGRTGALLLGMGGSWLEEGQPVGVWKYYEYDGVFEDQAMMDATIINANGETVAKYPKSVTSDGLGSPKFKDINQDGKIDKEDWVFIGNPNPDFIFSWTNNFTYKNFDLSIFITGSYGNDVINLIKGSNSPVSSQRREMLNYWTPQNTHTNIIAPRIAQHPNMSLSSWMIEDGSYVRLKNVVLGYRFPIKRVIESIRVYVSAQNLFTITNYTGFDPEVNSKGQDNLQLGVDDSPYPSCRIYTFGVNLSF